MSTFQACILRQAVELLYRRDEKKNHSVHSMPSHNARITALFVIPFIASTLNVQYTQHCLSDCHCRCVVPIADAMYRDVIFAVLFVMCLSPSIDLWSEISTSSLETRRTWEDTSSTASWRSLCQRVFLVTTVRVTCGEEKEGCRRSSILSSDV